MVEAAGDRLDAVEFIHVDADHFFGPGKAAHLGLDGLVFVILCFVQEFQLSFFQLLHDDVEQVDDGLIVVGHVLDWLGILHFEFMEAKYLVMC